MLVFWITLYQYDQETELLMSKNLYFSYNYPVVLENEETAYLISMRQEEENKLFLYFVTKQWLFKEVPHFNPINYDMFQVRKVGLLN